MRPAATQTDRASLILFLRADVLPHAAAEEAVLYPAVERALLTHGHATATMVMDHRAVARLLDEMAGLTAAANPTAYNRKACQLETILRTHFAREQDFVVPALQQRLSPAELDAVFASMRAFARH
jgi:hemerythrin-like domain-containing protein